jgi:pimeloyl-ACP methyl ester carboxylesterase
MDPERQKEFTDVAGLTSEQILEKNMDIYFSQDFINAHLEEVAEFIQVSLRYPQPEEAFLRQYNACLHHDTSNRANRIKVPVLIMTGDEDPLVPPENSYLMQKCIPHAELAVFPKGRHCFLIEMADEFNRRVLNFLKMAGS